MSLSDYLACVRSRNTNKPELEPKISTVFSLTFSYILFFSDYINARTKKMATATRYLNI